MTAQEVLVMAVAALLAATVLVKESKDNTLSPLAGTLLMALAMLAALVAFLRPLVRLSE
jgi:hypothetical protein